MTQNESNLHKVKEEKIRADVEKICNNLCLSVDGNFDFTLSVESDDETIQKLIMLINFILDSTRRSIDTQQKINKELKFEMIERERIQNEMEKINAEMLNMSREAGMAEIASGILHNVGNVLNSLNVSMKVLDRLHDEIFPQKLPILIQRIEGKSSGEIFNSSNKEGILIFKYLIELAKENIKLDKKSRAELNKAKVHLEHIINIIQTQQKYAKTVSVTEESDIHDLAEHCLNIHLASFESHNIHIERKYEICSPIKSDKHKIVQIILNLLNNAKDSTKESKNKNGAIIVSLLDKSEYDPNMIELSVEDFGMGIREDDYKNLFKHGFTTKKDGHGFGLHSCMNLANQIEGDIKVVNKGHKKGAIFSLLLPKNI